MPYYVKVQTFSKREVKWFTSNKLDRAYNNYAYVNKHDINVGIYSQINLKNLAEYYK